MKEVVFTKPPYLNASEQRIADMHSVLNILNILSGELSLVELCQPAMPEKLKGFEAMLEHNASDLHLATGNPPVLRLNGDMQHVDAPVLDREVGVHAKSFASALRWALREDPDIILVGEMRDRETIELAIEAAATGHLVFGTLHTPSAAKTIDRIIDVFPAEQQNQIRSTLSEAIKGVVAQNLFKRIDKPGRVAALEILVVDTPVANLIREYKTYQIPSIIEVGKKEGNRSLDDAIMEHLEVGRISGEDAFEKAIDKKKFLPFIKGEPEPWEM